MKMILTVLAFSFSVAAMAVECPSSAEEVQTQIEQQTECYFAAQIARECAWGSSIDVQFVAAAAEKCMDFQPKMNRSDKRMYKSLMNKCAKKYENEEGTLYRSMHAHCTLNVMELMHNLFSPVE
ncbi:MAG: hypothetical protein COW00_00465 [Bdellovibrio sp. CG12_big_fil_rev_8_21_14_0_65_39_13]|nr:MAG: hypothetical protein COW78_04400 [Bdellovibrio sp. CG22_combo_CG10-13_8_21_14_all_39_27]PIQ62956.1 MAG: hypothetical protein COW00_00465 [Bdellovibrio sp. CG12_big_fil_rev_8_21_14_0_65_39_13]PIR32587.1 MAG: hypothetical protein COV37_19440 [Bdellovibrio sp. CG11_big_fil_rev_8_21_14_0_20_39_38]PJB54474.1 MAG: hypothetical protein CO099_01375 [Bdellovibrio sp. CG_4_9_14_3_um_filter_39_7]